VTEEPSTAINFWLGKRYLQRAALRVFANLAIRLTAGAVLAPWRAVRTQRPARTVSKSPEVRS